MSIVYFPVYTHLNALDGSNEERTHIEYSILESSILSHFCNDPNSPLYANDKYGLHIGELGKIETSPTVDNLISLSAKFGEITSYILAINFNEHGSYCDYFGKIAPSKNSKENALHERGDSTIAQLLVPGIALSDEKLYHPTNPKCTTIQTIESDPLLSRLGVKNFNSSLEAPESISFKYFGKFEMQDSAREFVECTWQSQAYPHILQFETWNMSVNANTMFSTT